MQKSAIFLAASLLLTASGNAFAAGDPEAGKTKATTCAACHSADGNSVIPANPILAGQHADYLLQALKSYRSGERKNALMAAMVAPLSDQDMEDLAAYFAAQSGLGTPE